DLQLGPDHLRLKGERLTVGVLGELGPVNGDECLIGDEDVLIEDTQDKRHDDRDNDHTEEAQRGDTLVERLLGLGEVAAPVKYQRLAVPPTLQTRGLASELRGAG